MAHVVRTSITLGGSRLQDTQFTSVFLRQTIGWHHNIEIRLRQDANKGVLAKKAKEWIGQPVQIGIDLKAEDALQVALIPVVFKGIVTSVSLGRKRGSAQLVVKGQSPTIAVDDGPNTRSFTDKGLQEIADEVLKDYEGAFPAKPDVNPKAFSDSLPYTVQYKESNFAFLVRLANRYGEWFYYDGLNLYFGKPQDGDTIKLDFGEKSLIDFDLSVRAVPANFEIRGYDYVKHKTEQEGTPLSAPTDDLGKLVRDISTGDLYPGKTSTTVNTALDGGTKDLKDLAKRIDQVMVDEIVIMTGSSRNPKLKIGSKIEVNDKEIGETYGTYIITSLTHDIMQGGDYINHFEAIPDKVATPPLSMLPDPPFCETQLATVTDVDDDKKLGRIRVKFLWQEGSKEKTPWIRVASPYTGKDKGFYIIPEVDDQVLVAFENNHADKPYVLSGMYNGDAKPEWFDVKNRYKGFKSEGKNQWKFDDKAKSILVSAPSAMTLSAGKTITIKTGGKDDSSITLDAGEGTINIKAKTVNVEAGELIDLKSKKDIKLTANKDITQAASSNMKLKGNSKLTAESMATEVKGTASTKVQGAQVEVSGSAMVTVKAAMVKIN